MYRGFFAHWWVPLLRSLENQLNISMTLVLVGLKDVDVSSSENDDSTNDFHRGWVVAKPKA